MKKRLILQIPFLVLFFVVGSLDCAVAQNKVVVIPLFGEDGPVCCKVQSNGNLIAAESSNMCNADVSQTRRVNEGNYEVDFLDPLTDVRPKVKMVTLDTQIGGSVAWMVGVSDRSGDESSVFVKVRNHDNAAVNSGFNLCLF